MRVGCACGYRTDTRTVTRTDIPGCHANPPLWSWFSVSVSLVFVSCIWTAQVRRRPHQALTNGLSRAREGALWMLAVERLFSTAVGGGGGVHPSGTFRTQDVFSASVRGFFASSSSSQHSSRSKCTPQEEAREKPPPNGFRFNGLSFNIRWRNPL